MSHAGSNSLCSLYPNSNVRSPVRFACPLCSSSLNATVLPRLRSVATCAETRSKSTPEPTAAASDPDWLFFVLFFFASFRTLHHLFFYRVCSTFVQRILQVRRVVNRSVSWPSQRQRCGCTGCMDTACTARVCCHLQSPFFPCG